MREIAAQTVKATEAGRGSKLVPKTKTKNVDQQPIV
ncbi:hypothetical protein LINPERHAP1_LOCUS5834, partial [Linum perenne]